MSPTVAAQPISGGNALVAPREPEHHKNNRSASQG